jgi:hypothetical protein
METHDEASVTWVRLPIDLKDQITELARQNRRSVTKEIQVACESHCSLETKQ